MSKKTKLIPLTINRKKWARGGLNGEAALLNDQGNMCCLGFACRASGVAAKTLDGYGFPEDLASEVKQPERLGKKLGKLVEVTREENIVTFNNTAGVVQAQGVNDDDTISEKMREYKLKPILKKLGFDVTFVGPARPAE